MDTRALLPGDVIVSRSRKSPAGPAIELLQRAHRADHQTSSFVHAALFLGDGDMICEALPAGVVKASIHRFSDGHHALVARRVRGLSDAQRRRAAQLAEGYVGKRYDLIEPMGHLLRVLPPELGAAEPQARRSFICSTLCQDILIRAMDNAPTKKLPPVVMPFHFIRCDLMEDEPVPIAWACAAPRPV